MTYTMEQYHALKAAYVSGTASVTYAGQTVIYRSMQEIRQAINAIESEMNLRPVRQGPQSSPATYTKGL